MPLAYLEVIRHILASSAGKRVTGGVIGIVAILAQD